MIKELIQHGLEFFMLLIVIIIIILSVWLLCKFLEKDLKNQPDLEELNKHLKPIKKNEHKKNK
jgi:uncharacterized protein YneF (UPF0154 family)